MLTIRTDLAAEAHALLQENTAETTHLPGVIAEDRTCLGLPVTRVQILDSRGEEALGKPVGTYLTLSLDPMKHDAETLRRGALALRELLTELLPADGSVLVAGLGNRRLTADALGPFTVEHFLVTRHLSAVLPGLRPAAAISAGVLGDTGMEAAEWIQGAAGAVKPSAVIVVDALAAHSLRHLAAAVQLSDTGIIPGSGVGNHRKALNHETLGVPVIAVGVPLVADASAVTDGAEKEGEALFVTDRNVDRQTEVWGKLLGLGLTLATQPKLSLKDAEALLA